jgi:succinate dehydrogenase/fumarate reductase cytochrome b subunit
MLFGCFYLLQFIGGVVYKNLKMDILEKEKQLSPYLGVYVAEKPSIFSIIQRISGILLLLAYVVIELMVNLRFEYLTDSYFYSCIYLFLKASNPIFGALATFFWYIFFYHIVIGIKYVYWSNLLVSDLTLEEFDKVKVNEFFNNLLYFTLMLIIMISV